MEISAFRIELMQVSACSGKIQQKPFRKSQNGAFPNPKTTKSYLPGGLLGNLGEILGRPITEQWGRSPQYSLISPLESPQDSPEGLLEGLQKLKCGAHPGLPSSALSAPPFKGF